MSFPDQKKIETYVDVLVEKFREEKTKKFTKMVEQAGRKPYGLVIKSIDYPDTEFLSHYFDTSVKAWQSQDKDDHYISFSVSFGNTKYMRILELEEELRKLKESQ